MNNERGVRVFSGQRRQLTRDFDRAPGAEIERLIAARSFDGHIREASVALDRCSGSEGKPAPDQSAYEPLFRSASAIVDNYRALLAARRTVPEELARIETSGAIKSKSAAKVAKKAAPTDK